MGNRYDFNSPLAMGGAAMSEFFQQQKEEKRRQMLAELEKAQFEEQKRVHADQRRLTDEQIAESLLKRELTELEVATKGWMPGQDASTLPPNLQEIGRKRGLFGPQFRPPVPSVTTDEHVTLPDGTSAVPEGAPQPQTPVANQAPAGLYFRGHEEDIARQRRLANVGSVAHILSDPNISPSEKMLALYKASEDKDVPAQMYSALGERPAYVHSAETGKTTRAETPDGKPIMTGAQNPIIETGFRPRQPAAFQLAPWPSAKGHPISFNQYTNKYEENPNITVGLRTGAPAGGSGAYALPAAVMNKLADLRAKATPPEPGIWSRISGGTPEVPEAASAAYYQYLDSIIGNYVNKGMISPNMGLLVRNALDDERLDEYSIEQIIEAYKATGKITEEESPAFMEILSQLRFQQ